MEARSWHFRCKVTALAKDRHPTDEIRARAQSWSLRWLLGPDSLCRHGSARGAHILGQCLVDFAMSLKTITRDDQEKAKLGKTARAKPKTKK
jgi:hypothetical protein